MNLKTVELKAFVPAIDFAQSKAFYEMLGFQIPWSDGELAYVHAGDTSFLLQNFPHPEFASNFMMHLLIEDVAAWRSHVLGCGVVDLFGTRVGPLVDQLWNMRDFHLWDPAGVLWTVAQNTE